MEQSADIFDKLNERQAEAVRTTEGNVCVVAGAGSGKTKTLASRFAYIVSELGVSPSAVLCVTFTNKAAYEMKKRIRTMLPDKDLGYVTTVPGFGAVFFKEEFNDLGYPEAFVVMMDAIRRHHEKTGRKVGIKAAGGISDAETALLYLHLLTQVLGKEWLSNTYFRIGASRLATKVWDEIQ